MLWGGEFTPFLLFSLSTLFLLFTQLRTLLLISLEKMEAIRGKLPKVPITDLVHFTCLSHLPPVTQRDSAANPPRALDPTLSIPQGLHTCLVPSLPSASSVSGLSWLILASITHMV